VLVDDRTHKLGSALFAIAGALFFGLNFGRVLQLVHARAWQIQLPRRLGDHRLGRKPVACARRAAQASAAPVNAGRYANLLDIPACARNRCHPRCAR